MPDPTERPARAVGLHAFEGADRCGQSHSTRRTKLDEFGIRGGEGLAADIPAVLNRVRALRDQFVSGVLKGD